MEIRRRFNLGRVRPILISAYFISFSLFLWIGLMPVEATDYNIVAELKIPAINLSSDVTKLEMDNHNLKTPDRIVGGFSRSKNKTLLIGHSSTVFKDLFDLKIDDIVIYDEETFRVTNISIPRKDDINMSSVLAGGDKNTLILMTCAGKDLGHGDSTHRLIITAEVE